MLQITSIDELRKIGYQNSNNFSFNIPLSDDKLNTFHCSKITRCLPGKRISCIGQWKDKQVFAKFFIAPSRAKIHWQKEKIGFELLHQKQIPAPNILHTGKHYQDEVYFILFEFIENYADLQNIWNNADESQQHELLKQLTTTIADHHHKSIIQQDLHLNNFLLSEDVLYTLDGAGITSFDSSDKQKSSHNIALLFAQFYPSNDKHINFCLNCYATRRQWNLNPQLIEYIKVSTLKIRKNRLKELLQKTRRTCSLFSFQHCWKQLTIYTRKYQSSEMQDFIQSPDSYINQGEILKRGNTCTVAIVTIDNIKMVVKRYNIKNWRHFLSRAFRPSRAIISWTNAHLLQFYGIPTPEPIAVIEKRWGPVRKTAYFVSELSQGETGDLFFQSVKTSLLDKQTVAQSIVKLIQGIHSLNISHGDLKITNFIISGLSASILDLDSMKQHKGQSIFKKARTKDIKRFLKNWINDPTTAAMFNLEKSVEHVVVENLGEKDKK